MNISTYEHSNIRVTDLPSTFRSDFYISELEEFLQNNWEQRSVFYQDDKVFSKQQYLNLTNKNSFITNNYIGTIIFKGLKIDIYPKVFKLDKKASKEESLNIKHLMMNLGKWLEYSNKLDYPFININSRFYDYDNLRDFFISLYIHYVWNTIKRNIYYEYVEFEDDIKFVRGRFDTNDYFIKKIPQGNYDNFRCKYSEFLKNNEVNKIIKYTCKLLYNSNYDKDKDLLRKILATIADVDDKVCFPSDCNLLKLNIIDKNYITIINMSKMFLLNQFPDFSLGDDDSFCFLFPAELLFEGFVGGYVKEILTGLGGNVYLQKSDKYLIDEIEYGGKSLGPAFLMRHDILVELKDKTIIIDAKYKEISRFEGDDEHVKKVVSTQPKQSDIYQVCEYARKRGISDVYLFYPMYRLEENEPYFPKCVSGNIKIHFFRVPFVFENDNYDVKKMLKEKIIEMVDDNF